MIATENKKSLAQMNTELVSAPAKFLSESQLRTLVPAAFAEAPSSKVSKHYHFVPTFEIVKRMDEYGFGVVDGSNPVCKSQGKTGQLIPSTTGAHLINFEARNPVQSDEGRLRVVLTNSHDRSRRFRLAAGFFRFVCTNGLIASNERASVTATHIDLHMLGIDEQIESVLSQANLLLETPGTWGKINLSGHRQTSFAKKAMQLRFGPERLWRVTAEQVLAARRPQDEGSDLWRTFNRVQENLVRGGLYNERTPMPTFPLTRPKQTFDFNARLWELAESYAN